MLEQIETENELHEKVDSDMIDTTFDHNNNLKKMHSDQKYLNRPLYLRKSPKTYLQLLEPITKQFKNSNRH